MKPPRRVITGIGVDGRSCMLFDGPASGVIWSTDGPLADNKGTADTGRAAFDFPASGTRFIFHDFPAHSAIDMHASDTIDYIVVVAGEVTFITENGETLLRTGDVIVDRGILHGWRNDGDEPCRIMNVLAPAHPVGRGATISGEVPS